jgi:hypothetical protein
MRINVSHSLICIMKFSKESYANLSVVNNLDNSFSRLESKYVNNFSLNINGSYWF